MAKKRGPPWLQPPETHLRKCLLREWKARATLLRQVSTVSLESECWPQATVAPPRGQRGHSAQTFRGWLLHLWGKNCPQLGTGSGSSLVLGSTPCCSWVQWLGPAAPGPLPIVFLPLFCRRARGIEGTLSLSALESHSRMVAAVYCAFPFQRRSCPGLNCTLYNLCVDVLTQKPQDVDHVWRWSLQRGDGVKWDL